MKSLVFATDAVGYKFNGKIASGKVGPVAEVTNSESFEEIVEWAYSTLPQEIRDLPDFPGIQVADEPPEDILKRRNSPRGTEMLGLYSGILRHIHLAFGGT
jgi:hypothetical protein